MKKQFYLIFMVIMLATGTTWGQKTKLPEAPVTSDSLVNFALTLLGTPYTYAGNSPQEGFDCSGFVHYVFKNFMIDVPRVSRSFGNFGEEVDKASCQKGDVIVFTGTAPDTKTIGHVGIVISGKGEPVKFVHASSYKSRKGIVTNLLESGKYPERFVGIRRVAQFE